MSNKIIPPSYEGRKHRTLMRRGSRLQAVLWYAQHAGLPANRSGVREAMRLAKKKGAPRSVGRGLVR